MDYFWDWKGLCANSGEKHVPTVDPDTVKMNSLKVLDLNRPIREATENAQRRNMPRQTGSGKLLPRRQNLVPSFRGDRVGADRAGVKFPPQGRVDQ
jgi:hypothetical protein